MLVREGMPVVEVEEIIEPLSIPVLPFTGEMAWRAGRGRAQLSPGLGIADRCCLAAAAVTQRPVVTADSGWVAAARAFGVDLVMVR
ncbi:MAG: PIN domain-containing protein [Candidatus Dormibacteria bacterium]